MNPGTEFTEAGRAPSRVGTGNTAPALKSHSFGKVPACKRRNAGISLLWKLMPALRLISSLFSLGLLLPDAYILLLLG